ncbi:hypothetical protein KTD18_22280 [Burkholderia multivorans]|uniref:hypothetical protein n=2 Tax=Burkholderia multivorans TaxID=87883 RepID=UPI0011B1FBF0|nr:hypothetical protein [Burkholderia multivorans]MBU9294273.1 hypothetical protein [Burkholderia multivorans]
MASASARGAMCVSWRTVSSPQTLRGAKLSFKNTFPDGRVATFLAGTACRCPQHAAPDVVHCRMARHMHKRPVIDVLEKTTAMNRLRIFPMALGIGPTLPGAFIAASSRPVAPTVAVRRPAA